MAHSLRGSFIDEYLARYAGTYGGIPLVSRLHHDEKRQLENQEGPEKLSFLNVRHGPRAWNFQTVLDATGQVLLERIVAFGPHLEVVTCDAVDAEYSIVSVTSSADRANPETVRYATPIQDGIKALF